MNKTEFVAAVAEYAELTNVDAGRAVNAALRCILVELQKGGQVAFPGFGTFSVSHRSERNGRNPNTGEVINIPAANAAKFKAGKSLKDAVNGNLEESK